MTIEENSEEFDLRILLKSLKALSSRVSQLGERVDSSDLRLGVIEEKYEGLEHLVSRVVDKNNKLSWTACPWDDEGKSWEDFLQKDEECKDIMNGA